MYVEGGPGAVYVTPPLALGTVRYRPRNIKDESPRLRRLKTKTICVFKAGTTTVFGDRRLVSFFYFPFPIFGMRQDDMATLGVCLSVLQVDSEQSLAAAPVSFRGARGGVDVRPGHP